MSTRLPRFAAICVALAVMLSLPVRGSAQNQPGGAAPAGSEGSAASAGSTPSTASTITVQADRPGADISPLMYGVFFEDINFAADGGIYPERVKNGSFEFEDPMMGWRKVERGGVVGGLGLREDGPLNDNNPHYLRIFVERPGEGANAGFGLTNSGFRGIGITQGAKYTFSVYARSTQAPGTEPMSLSIELLAGSRPLAQPQQIGGFTGEWKKYSCTIEATATVPNAGLTIVARGQGTLDIDMVSLFPQDTFNNRPNGLRPDLVNLLKEMNPSFIRFPGGCIVEGRVLSQRYQWKNTIGDLSERKLLINRWNVEFNAPRNAPDYYQSFGLGFFEYFQLCEDIGAEPLPILNCGMACQFNFGELVPLDELGPYVQDVLDLIEFANGPSTSTWGAKRAAMGHPEPFNLKMVGIGNEQWGPQYFARYEIFAKAVREKHPEIKLVSGSGPSPADQRFNFAWGELRRLGGQLVDFVDEHYYVAPDWLYGNVNRYDGYDRAGLKVFAGEYAAHTRPEKRNNWEGALAEAAFITGLERNADIVRMASYAPLLAHVDAWQWNPNLIWFDNLRSFGTPSYYVQKLFSTNRGTKILPVSIGAGSESPQRLYACAALDEKTGQIIVKVVNAAPEARAVRIQLAGTTNVAGTGQMHVLSAPDLAAENTLDEPTKLAPVSSEVTGLSSNFQRQLPGYSLTVLRIPTAAR